MKNSSPVYSENLTLFMNVLRRNGLPVGLKESEDAIRIAREIGFEDRTVFRLSLMSVLAKSEKEQKIFTQVFDSFFLPEEELRRRAEEARKKQQEHEEQLRRAGEELSVNGEELKIRQELKEVYIQLSKTRREEMMKYLEKAGKHIHDRNTGILYTNYISHMVEQQLLREEGELFENQKVSDEGLMAKNIGDFSEEELPRAIALIENLTRQLNKKLLNRRKRSGRTGTLDFKRTIRYGLQTGGTLNRLQYRRRGHKRKRLILICDVSASMLRVSEFALRFIQALNESAEEARVFLFSEGLQEADSFALNDMDTFEKYVSQSPLWCKGTDMGSALQTLLSMDPSPLGQNTLVLLISDAQTVNLPLAEREVENLQAHTSHIYWFNPISARRWEESKSIRLLRPYCTMLGCSTLEELSIACEKALGDI